MSSTVKDRVREVLGELGVHHFGLFRNLEGELLSDGKLLKWALRDSKPQEPWSFSITLAMSLAAAGKGTAEEIAAFLSRELNEKISGAWVFVSEKAYINVYFKPASLKDYLEGKDALNWEALKTLKGGSYAYYRLQVLGKALEARGLGNNMESILNEPLANPLLAPLFDYPERAPGNDGKWVSDWEDWLNFVAEMTRKGYLRNLDPNMEEVCLAFIKACLS